MYMCVILVASLVSVCEEVSYEEECCDCDTEVLQRMDSESAPTLYELRDGGMGRDVGVGREGATTCTCTCTSFLSFGLWLSTNT